MGALAPVGNRTGMALKLKALWALAARAFRCEDGRLRVEHGGGVVLSCVVLDRAVADCRDWLRLPMVLCAVIYKVVPRVRIEWHDVRSRRGADRAPPRFRM